MTYMIAEKFKSPQGEGLYAGTPMAFIRFVGCSVGKKICNACDTTFERELPWQGGGEFAAAELLDWTGAHQHVLLTGGEPLNWNLEPFFCVREWNGTMKVWHVETSGTVLLPRTSASDKAYVCVSPKPGWLPEMIERADEVKVIVGGLGSGEGWPDLVDALRWAKQGKLVFLQPRNLRSEVDRGQLRLVQELVKDYPQLRLSVQMHKLLEVR